MESLLLLLLLLLLCELLDEAALDHGWGAAGRVSRAAASIVVVRRRLVAEAEAIAPWRLVALRR
jgi:hypothetical protein